MGHSYIWLLCRFIVYPITDPVRAVFFRYHRTALRALLSLGYRIDGDADNPVCCHAVIKGNPFFFAIIDPFARNRCSAEFAPGIRYIDRFVIRNGLIIRQDVWNDLAESGVLDRTS